MTGTLTTTGNDHWEQNISLGDIEGLGGRKVAILLEPLSQDPTDAYPILSGDNIGPNGASVFGKLDSLSAMQPSSIGDFLQNLWIGVPFRDGMKTIVPRKITIGELFNSSKQPVRSNSIARPSR